MTRNETTDDKIENTLANAQSMLERVLNSARTKIEDVKQDAKQYERVKEILTEKKGLTAGAAAGALAMVLFGGARPGKVVKNSIKLGGLALIGGLAYKAYKNWEDEKATGVDADLDMLENPDTPFAGQDGTADRLSETLIQTMIATAKADGSVSPDEKALILSELENAGYDGDQKDFLDREIETNRSPQEIAARIRTQEEAAEVYIAALLVTGVIDNQDEMAWLHNLSDALDLDQKLVEHLHSVIDSATA